MLKQLVSRENGSSDVDLSVRVQHALVLVEVDVCVAPEPLGLHEGSSRVCRMVVACPVVGTVAVGCSWARFTVTLRSHFFLSFLCPSGAVQRIVRRMCVRLCVMVCVYFLTLLLLTPPTHALTSVHRYYVLRPFGSRYGTRPTPVTGRWASENAYSAALRCI